MNKPSTIFTLGSSLVCLSIFLTGCATNCTYMSVICPVTNMPVNYPKSQKCAKLFYEDAVRTYSPRFKGDIDILSKIKILSVDAGVDAKAELLKAQLTSEHQLMQGVLQSATLLLAARPCDGIVAYTKAMDDVANYKIRLDMIAADVKKNERNDEALKKVLDNYTIGKQAGQKVGIIRGALDRYYVENNKYPVSLSLLTSDIARDSIASLGLSISYHPDTPETYTLRFAGEDGVLNSPDDKIHKHVKGKPATE